MLLIVVLLIIAVGLFQQSSSTREVTMSELAALAAEGRVVAVEVLDNNELNVELSVEQDGSREVTSRKEEGSTAYEQLLAFGVPEENLAAIDYSNARAPNFQGIWVTVITILPIVAIFAFVLFMMRNAQGANNQAMSFGKSRARMINPDQPTVTFDDVAGSDEAKEELAEVVEFLREPAKFIQLGARIPKGVLLVGMPGTGKTLLAKAVAGEAGVPFFSISGSEFVEMFVGVGASRVRDLFEQAKRHSPCIVFVDEIDAVGRQRGAGLGGSHDEREQTLNQILVEMDGFDTDTNIIILAATNRPDILDPALLRPGRFDRRVVMDRPDVKGREEIFKVHVRGKPLAPDVELDTLAAATPGFVGADIENTVNEAAILAARQNKKLINMGDFQEAIERVVMGPERRSRLITTREKEIVAYHEAGHAVVGHLLEFCDPVLKVTIIPRGMAGGYTLAPPREDMRYMPRSKFMDDLAMMLGGRLAEEIIFDEITTGASNDLERVTKTARAMVTRYGMSDRLGPMIFGQKEELVFLGREIGEQRDYSESVAEEIDAEVRRIVSEAYERARTVLTQHRDKLDLIAQTLIDVETLERDGFARLMEGLPLETEADEEHEAKARDKQEEEAPQSRRGTDTGGLELPPAPSPA
ncbi:MAG: ATP-dependent zinc metalloprotease FtsH [Chloroflexi bacterium]|nr:ATP-dependent zinc metalloprotease FtsH [Chloroflexota bacterium]